MNRIEAYIRLAIIFIVGICILYLPILFVLKKKGISPVRQLSYIGLFCSAFLIIFATIFYVLPIDFHPESYILNLNPVNWLGSVDSVQQFVVEKIPNILMFIPLGIFLPAVFKKERKFYKTALIALATTFCVEFMQYFIGRSADIVDIITNLLGAVIGYGIFKIFDKILKSKKMWNKFLGNN